MSKSSNEVDRFNAAIALFGNQVTPEFVDRLAAGMIKVIDDLDGNSEGNPNLPKYLHKDLSGINEFYNNLLKTTQQFYNESIGMLNFSDKDFGGGTQTGIALRIKMYGMEVKAAQIETYFNRGLYNRLYLYADIFNASTMNIDVDEYKVSVKSNRNLPVDDEAKLRIAAMLMGLGLDLKHIINYLPNSIVDNMTDKEIEEMLNNGIVEEDGLIVPEGGNIEDKVEVAKLSGIQITSANDIINQVATGIISREAGINQLMVFLGLTKEQAEKVMGKQVKKAIDNKTMDNNVDEL